MAGILVDDDTCFDVKLIDDLIVSACEDVAAVIGEFDGGETSVSRLEGANTDLIHVVLGLEVSQIPEFAASITAGRDEEVAAQLHRVDRSNVTAQDLDEFECSPRPNADGVVFGTRDNVVSIEADVENTGVVVLKPRDRVVRLHVPDQAGGVRGTSHHDLLVVLKAENRCAVVFFG